MRTANPALNEKTFKDYALWRESAASTDMMTLQGTVMKTGAMLLVLFLAAGYTWSKTLNAETVSSTYPWIIGGAIGGLVLALIIIFKNTTAPYLAPAYAACEGLFLGSLSAGVNLVYPGIVLQAVLLTMGVAVALLLAYTSRLIKPSENFKLGVTAATGGIMMLYMMSWILGMFGVPMGFLHGSGWMSIGFSAFVVVIAALNLVLDFDFIENAVDHGAPKHMEWVGAFGLTVTLVWLYLEILRLLMKLRGRD
jgi:uncharacterized YccA/Bax inhibitor family protein